MAGINIPAGGHRFNHKPASQFQFLNKNRAGIVWNFLPADPEKNRRIRASD
jgi:hypothetical protein